MSRHRRGREPGDVIWVRSDRTHDDAYVATVEVGPDVTIPLDHLQALRYVAVVSGVVARAEYDAAVIAQMVEMGAKPAETGAVVAQLRTRYPTLDDGATAPLAFTPLVSARNQQPYVHVTLDGVLFCQWDPASARQHMGQVLDVATMVDLDRVYLGYLTSVVQLPPDVAHVAVDNLGQWRLGGRHDARDMHTPHTEVVDRWIETATALWRAEAPAERDGVQPDPGELLGWLVATR